MEDTEGGTPKLTRLLPVEINRLIYTYLGQVNCRDTQSAFVKENHELKELSSLVEKKLLRTLDFDLFGHNLENVLKEYVL